MKKTQKLTFLSMCVAIALLLGYVESLIPFFSGIPGIKLGLPNVIIVWILYTYSFKDAFLVNIVRVTLNAILFGNIYSFIFSFIGGCISLCIMYLLHKLNFHIYSVSMMGGIFHNIGQMLMALLLTSTQMIYHLPVLLVSGMICGTLNGIISDKLIPHLIYFERS